MAFLDNSGDIILDAVLTDTGRLRLAQGDGSFKISKFALGDDEINYELYNKSHASGSSYYDLEVLQTPVLEAFTNNTSNLKSKLVSLSRTNVLYMPVLRLNHNIGYAGGIQHGASNFFERTVPVTGEYDSGADKSDTKFYVAVDEDTVTALRTLRQESSTALTTFTPPVYGLIQGYTVATSDIVYPNNLIRVDQGLETDEIAPSLGLDQDLYESAYIIEMDYRLGRVKPPANKGETPAAVNFIDDDNIASYYLTDNNYVNPENGESPGTQKTTAGSYKKTDLDAAGNPMVFKGPRGSTVQFRVQASSELQSSTYLFTQIGTSVAANTANFLGLPTTDQLTSTKTIYYIDSTVRVVGANTGYRLDIPVRYIKIA
mgnify:FL=1